MPSTDFLLALFAVIVSWFAYRKAAALTSSVAAVAEDAKREAQRRAGAVEESLSAEIDTLRRTLALLAKGEELSPEMIADGQLWRDVDPEMAQALVQDRAAHVLDVRTPAETGPGIIAGAIVIPMDEIETRKAELPRDGRPILVYCAAGGRSAAVCEHLSQDGFESLHNLTGGFGSWKGATTPGPTT